MNNFMTYYNPDYDKKNISQATFTICVIIVNVVGLLLTRSGTHSLWRSLLDFLLAHFETLTQTHFGTHFGTLTHLLWDSLWDFFTRSWNFGTHFGTFHLLFVL